jgi:hypothetical protein
LAAGVLVVAGHEHGGAENQVTPGVKLGEGLLFEALLFTALSEPAASVAVGHGIRLVDDGNAVGGDAVAEVDADDAAVLAEGAGVVAGAAGAGFPGHRPALRSGATDRALHNTGRRGRRTPPGEG